METNKVPGKKVRASRSSSKIADQIISRYASLYRDCVRHHWSLDVYIEERRAMRAEFQAAALTHFDSGRAYAAGSIFFDLVNSSAELEWRLGHADVSTAVATWTYGENPDGSRNLPTHGGHFWKGTDLPFNGWNRF